MSFLNKFPEYSKTTSQLLWDRSLKTQKAIDEFFSPDYEEDLHNPFLLKDVKKTIKRLEMASERKEKVAVFADYDADGVCGATLLAEILKIFKIKPETYIPDRNLEGYGLNLKAIEQISKKKFDLILTIDCGISDFEEIKLANKLGMEVIVIDHHEVPKKLPPALAIINPKQKDCKYPFKQFSATGVAFKLAQAVAKTKKLSISWEKWLLDLVAISTITDSMVLLKENRTLVRYGLIVLSQTKRVGLRALMEIARIKPVFNPQTQETNLSAYTLGFILGPRINAASRVDHGMTAYKLLIAFNKSRAEKLALKLEEKNRERQKTTEKIIKEVRQRVLSHSKNKKIIIEGNKDWLAGVVGLVAQKIKDEFCRPCFLYQEIGDYSIGSVRGVPGFNVVNVLTRCKKFLKEFGGHPNAGGFKVFNKDIDGFRSLLEKVSNEELRGKKPISYLNIDAEIDVIDLTWSVFGEIQRFAPFGEGNPTPLFMIKRFKVLNIRKVGSNGGHLKIYLEKGSKKFDAIGFNLGGFCDKIKVGDKIDIVFELIANEWNGTKELQLKIADLKKS